MNRNKLKTYAPKARREFIRAVTDRAAYYGLTKKKIEPVTEEGDVAIIAGKPFPRRIATMRAKLEHRIKGQGFDQVMEAMAYTWFNRMMAIRFMELHGYLEHGYRVLSHPQGTASPEIIENAEHVDLPGLDKQKVIELKLEGTKESELFNMLFLAQCHALHQAMPFLFEAIDDETELLLPDKLLHSDSVIRKMVSEIDEADWHEVEVVGWLYQFYISEKKDEVIGKVVKSEDIPAATQLFTPNWIVKYLVQNSLGRQWVATCPDSPLKGQMEYYVEPAEQTPEVQEQLKAITPDSLNPEELTLLDPACGSGHILVEAYDLLKTIYQERGYRAKDIPRLILEKNLYGLEIDDRAAQLAAFALMMKARADDRRIYSTGVQPHVLAIQESKGLDAREITEALNQPIFKGEAPPPDSLFEEIDDEKAPLFSRRNLSEPGQIPLSDVAQLIALFEHGKTFGALIQVPEKLAAKLPAIAERVEAVMAHGGMFEKVVAGSLKPLIEQARILAEKNDAVVTNPPYMGGKYMNAQVKAFIRDGFKEHDSDLFAVFVARSAHFLCPHGCLAFMTPFVWMFLSSYEPLRQLLSQRASILTLVRPEYHAFFESAYVPICGFVAQMDVAGVRGDYIDLSEFYGEEVQPLRALEAINDPACAWRHCASGFDFEAVPGCPIAYWISDKVRDAFRCNGRLADVASPRAGLATGDNNRFQREWTEVSFDRIGFGLQSTEETCGSTHRWFPCNSGGDFRKWYGNNETVVDWENDGFAIRNFVNEHGRLRSRPQNRQYYFKPGVTWTKLSSSSFGARLREPGFIFDDTGRSAFPGDPALIQPLLALMCSNSATYFLSILSPTLSYTSGDIANIPTSKDVLERCDNQLVHEAITLAQEDWDSHELSWGFRSFPILTDQCLRPRVSESYDAWAESCKCRLDRMREVELRNNTYFIHAYGIQDELSAEVPEDQITLYRPDREEDIQRLVSYAIGCMMGRYSLDKPGLIYAHSGNQGFDPSHYETFAADQDGIVPVTDTDWFPDDAANRVVEFVATAWPKEHVEENLMFVGESLGPKKGESPRDTVRRYLSQGFYKHHLSMYKKRPIYWLFSSGKQRAFECLVYLHRYNEGTLGRMRTEYVIPLQGKIDARIGQLADDIVAATSTAHRNKLQKERDKLLKQQTELQAFDEQLRHYADQRISLDLDDGVKVNYGKFGDLLAEVKAITGKVPGE